MSIQKSVLIVMLPSTSHTMTNFYILLSKEQVLNITAQSPFQQQKTITRLNYCNFGELGSAMIHSHFIENHLEGMKISPTV